jgi:hypothetical protein
MTRRHGPERPAHVRPSNHDLSGILDGPERGAAYVATNADSLKIKGDLWSGFDQKSSLIKQALRWSARLAAAVGVLLREAQDRDVLLGVALHQLDEQCVQRPVLEGLELSPQLFQLALVFELEAQ